MVKLSREIYEHKGYRIQRTFDFLNPNCRTFDVKWYAKSRSNRYCNLRADTLNGMVKLINDEISQS